MMLLSLLLTAASVDGDYLRRHPLPAYHLCEEMEHDVYQGVEFGIITDKQANALLMRCLINYSSLPSNVV